jgi:NYN domain
MPIKTAMFIDFDNFHSNLEKADPRAADRFADDPAAWLDWFRLGRHVAEDAEPRRILLRRCYLNPDRFYRQRAAFVRAGFSVHDCPALTTRGKNAADIWMALDIVDAITHPTGFEEFIVLATDADFTPVMLRLREHDRRTVLVNDQTMAGALRAATDLVVPQERFIAGALGLAAEPAAATPPDSQAGVESTPRARFRPPVRPDRLGRALDGQAPDLVALATRLQAAIGVPSLSPDQYRAVFDAMAVAIRETGSFDLVGRTVDRCRAAGMEIGLRPVGDIRETLRDAGFDFQAEDTTASGVAMSFHAAILALCREQTVVLTEAERMLLDHWLGAPTTLGAAS